MELLQTGHSVTDGKVNSWSSIRCGANFCEGEVDPTLAWPNSPALLDRLLGLYYTTQTILHTTDALQMRNTRLPRPLSARVRTQH